jgi:hypothetical protein
MPGFLICELCSPGASLEPTRETGTKGKDKEDDKKRLRKMEESDYEKTVIIREREERVKEKKCRQLGRRRLVTFPTWSSPGRLLCSL